MGGIRSETPHDSAYVVLIVLTGISVVLIGPLIIAYLVGIIQKRKAHKAQEVYTSNSENQN